MSRNRTSGFDILFQMSEGAITLQLANDLMFGRLLTSLPVSIVSGGLSGMVNFSFSGVFAEILYPPPKMTINLLFRNSFVEIASVSSPVPINGQLSITADVEVVTFPTHLLVGINLNSSSSTSIRVFLDPFPMSLGAAGLSQRQIEDILSADALPALRFFQPVIALIPSIPMADDVEPNTIYNVEATTVYDPFVVSHNCLAVGIRTSSRTGGNIHDVNENFIPPASSVMSMMSNVWLLGEIIRPRVAAAFGLLQSDFDIPLQLNHPVSAPGGRGQLTVFGAVVFENRIRVNGTVTDSGPGWHSSSNFEFFIDVTFSRQVLELTVSTPTVESQFDVEPWLAALIVTLTGFAAVSLDLIALRFVREFADSVATDLISSEIGSRLDFLPIPIDGLAISDVVLDDLEIHYFVARLSSIPVRNSGEYSSGGGFTLDLDTGEIDSAVTPETDLVWDPARGFLTQGASGLTVTGTLFGGLTPAQISGFPLSSRLISMSSVPFSFPVPVLSTPVREVVFGMRTTLGRYAKVRAFRNQADSNNLFLEWVTYDTPAAELELRQHWSVAERGEVTAQITDFDYCESSEVGWSGVFEAWPKLMAFPVNYQWCLCGQVLAEGKGSIQRSGGNISYQLEGRFLQLQTEKGKGIECELCVSAVDHRGLELFRCINISKPGIQTRCRKPPPSLDDKFRIEVIPPDPAIANWRTLNVAELLKTGK